MQIYIMRHGKAENIMPMSHEQDIERALTRRGFSEAKAMAKHFNNDKLTHVWVSPYLRAQQTCQQLVSNLTYKPNVKTLISITPSDSAQQFHDYLDGVLVNENIECLLVVSHMPLVSYLVEQLTHGQQAPIFQTAAIAHIDYDMSNSHGRLVAMMLPKDV